jgi:ubiquinone/menaquinone biosynthesis C-methylase UbiE
MRLIDSSCGPGSITIDLAQIVAPGEVVGIDMQAGQITQAKQLAADRQIANVRFEVGDVSALPFADRSFDAAFAPMWLHLRDPLRALKEMRRVLQEGGVIGGRDRRVAASSLAPVTPRLERLLELRLRYYPHTDLEAIPTYVQPDTVLVDVGAPGVLA